MIETIRTAAIVGCVLAGLFFTLVSTVGVLRLPDVYSRAHTASQADTLGAGFGLAAVALSLGWETTTIKTVLLLFFIFVTNPTAAHAISRAADEQGIEPWRADDDRTDQMLYEESMDEDTLQDEDSTVESDATTDDRSAGATSDATGGVDR
ncbi:monovalent cation/H(+) antiporter subunit G [Halovenus marina]|uniref:monovalent cation/H(+) antiporter subunit G n=1 Tax=Halovenus marina TaxID=3396621 RepID=UPI003F56013F